jgi:hypothetical protein
MVRWMVLVHYGQKKKTIKKRKIPSPSSSRQHHGMWVVGSEVLAATCKHASCNQ